MIRIMAAFLGCWIGTLVGSFIAISICAGVSSRWGAGSPKLSALLLLLAVGVLLVFIASGFVVHAAMGAAVASTAARIGILAAYAAVMLVSYIVLAFVTLVIFNR